MITAFVVLAVFAPLITQYDPTTTSWTLIRKGPSLAHWNGHRRERARRVCRVVFGARASLLAGVVSVVIAAGIGVPLGLLSGSRAG